MPINQLYYFFWTETDNETYEVRKIVAIFCMNWTKKKKMNFQLKRHKKAMSCTWPPFYCKIFLIESIIELYENDEYWLFRFLSVAWRMTKDFTNLDFWSNDWILLEKFVFFFIYVFIQNWLIKSQQHMYLCFSPDNSRRMTNWIVQMIARY